MRLFSMSCLKTKHLLTSLDGCLIVFLTINEKSRFGVEAQNFTTSCGIKPYQGWAAVMGPGPRPLSVVAAPRSTTSATRMCLRCAGEAVGHRKAHLRDISKKEFS